MRKDIPYSVYIPIEQYEIDSIRNRIRPMLKEIKEHDRINLKKVYTTKLERSHDKMKALPDDEFINDILVNDLSTVHGYLEKLATEQFNPKFIDIF